MVALHWEGWRKNTSFIVTLEVCWQKECGDTLHHNKVSRHAAGFIHLDILTVSISWNFIFIFEKSKKTSCYVSRPARSRGSSCSPSPHSLSNSQTTVPDGFSLRALLTSHLSACERVDNEALWAFRGVVFWQKGEKRPSFQEGAP